MPRNYDDILAKCPFFYENSRKSVICEGITDDSILCLKFLSENGRDKQRRIFCDKNYEKCEIFRMLMKKYEE